MSAKDTPDMIYDIVIIGAGPAGLTAAIYASRSRLKTLAMENPALIGQAAYADMIENYPGFPEGIKGMELLDLFKKQALKFGTEFFEEGVEGYNGGTHGGYVMYDLVNDPYQLNNLVDLPGYALMQAELWDMLQTLMKESGEAFFFNIPPRSIPSCTTMWEQY